MTTKEFLPYCKAHVLLNQKNYVLEVADKVSGICKNLGILSYLNLLTEKPTAQAPHLLQE